MDSRRRLPLWVGLGVAVALAGARLTGWPAGPAPTAATVVGTLGNGAAVAAGLVAWVRRPDSQVGRLLLAWGVLGLVIGLGADRGGPADTVGYVAIPLYWAVLAHALLTYPDGRAHTAGERRLVWSLYTAGPVLWTATAVAAHRAGSPCAVGRCRFDIGQLSSPGTVVTGLWLLQKAVSIGFAAWLVILVVRRWRRLSPAQRRTAGPVVWAAGGPLAVFVLFAALDLAEVRSPTVWLVYQWLRDATAFWVPLALLAGLLRTRLTRADVADLLVRLHTMTVDELRPALARLLRDPLLEIAVVDGAAFNDGDGRRVATPIGAGTLLLHHPSTEVEDPPLFAAAVAAAAMTLDNARLTAQVRAQLAEVDASRARLVEAAEQERRRIERDLHDGAQQQLLGLGMSLQAARASVPDDTSAATYLDEATAQLRDALAELRALSRGLRPALLQERGLGAALREVQRRATVPVRLAVDLAVRPDPAVETVAYFVVAEAVQNAARYATGAQVTVDVRQRADTVEVTVCDDGPGGADRRAGSGLRGLHDRVAAAGGALTVVSPAGGGTMVAARLPMTARLAATGGPGSMTASSPGPAR
jgi:signal transduction histidine kinase